MVSSSVNFSTTGMMFLPIFRARTVILMNSSSLKPLQMIGVSSPLVRARTASNSGSKPELLAVLALTNGLDTPIICNGFKDDEFIKMTVLARKIGKNIIPVVEKFTELETIVRYAG